MRESVSLLPPRSPSYAGVDTLEAPENLSAFKSHTSESLRPPSVSILFGIVVFLLVGFFAWRNLSTWSAIINYPDDESYEGVVLATMIHLRQGVPIYAPDATEKFDGATYGPLYYLLGERLVNPKNPSYVPLRLLSTFAILGCAGGCGLLGFWLTRNQFAAWLSSFVFLSYGMVTGHGLLALSDSVALLLAFSGFLVAYRFRNTRAVLFAAPIMVLSFYYKPQYIAGPLAVMLFLLLEKRYRRAIEFAGLLSFCGLGMFALFQWVVFSGQAFWRHFLLYQTSLLSWQLFGRALFTFALLLILPLISAFEYLRKYPNKLIGCYLFLAILLGLLTYCKKAGGVHYFFESALLLCVLISAFLASRLARRVYPVDLIVMLGIMLVAGQWQKPRAPQPSDIAQHNAMQSFLVRNFPPHALALSHDSGDLLQAGLEEPFPSLYEIELFSRLGIVSDRGLIAQIQDHRFAVIVLHFDISQEHDPDWLKAYATPPVLRAIDSNYQLNAVLGMPAPLRKKLQDRFYIYVLKPNGTVSATSRPEQFPVRSIADAQRVASSWREN